MKLEITDDSVVLSGERKSEHEQTKGGVHVSEWSYGRFYRTVPLPEGAKTDQARTRFDNGVLEITIPSEQAKSQRREIPIEGSGKSASSSTASSKTGSTGKAA
jgi:HSP20 family protein